MRKLKLQELNRPTVEEFKATEKIPLVIVLDNIRSALNVGSIFRTADAVGCAKILLCGITATPPNREVHKTAIGATDSVEWHYFEETTDAVKSLKEEGFSIYAIEQTDDSILFDDFQGEDKIAIIMGNEVKGVSDEALPFVDGAIELPQYGTKHSFNVSVCAGIVAYNIGKKLRE